MVRTTVPGTALDNLMLRNRSRKKKSGRCRSCRGVLNSAGKCSGFGCVRFNK